MNMQLIFVSICTTFLVQIATIYCSYEESSESSKLVGNTAEDNLIEGVQPLRARRPVADVLYNRRNVSDRSKRAGNVDNATDQEAPTFPNLTTHPKHLGKVSNFRNLPREQQHDSRQMHQDSDNALTQIVTLNVGAEGPKMHLQQKESNHQRWHHNSHNNGVMHNILKHKSETGLLIPALARAKTSRRNIYQLKGFDGDRGSVKFEKKVFEPASGNKEISWIIRIKQIVFSNSDTGENWDEGRVEVTQPKNKYVKEEKVQREDTNIEKDKKDNAKSTNSITKRHLMEVREGDTNDEDNLQREPVIDRDEAASSESRGESSSESSTESSSEPSTESNREDTEPDQFVGENHASENGASGFKNSFEKVQDTEDMNSTPVKETLGDEEVASLLRQEMDNEKDDPRHLKFFNNLASNKEIRKQLNSIVERLHEGYNTDYFRRRRRGNNYNYFDNDDANLDVDKTISKLINDGEHDKKEMYRATKKRIGKREVEDDVSGNYGVAVNDNDDANVPKEYDIEVENGVKVVRLPRDVEGQQQRLRREAAVQHTTREENVHGYISHDEGKRLESSGSNSASLRSNLAEAILKDGSTQHGVHDVDSANVHSEAKIIGVGYILFNNDGTVKETKHSELTKSEQDDLGNIPSHHRRPCNDSNGSKVNSPHHHHHHHHHHHSDSLDGRNSHHGSGDKLPPCHTGQRKHHHDRMTHNGHHVIGRTEKNGNDGYHHNNHHNHQQFENHNDYAGQRGDHEHHNSETYPHENQNGENHISENHNSKIHGVAEGNYENHHLQDRGTVIVETFRAERVGDQSGSHSHHARHSGSAVHVLVILSIFLVFFTVILFLIVRNSDSVVTIWQQEKRKTERKSS